MPRKKASSKTLMPEATAVKVVVDAPDDATTIYANYAEATLGQHDCLISFAVVPAKLNARKTEETQGGTLRVEPLVQIAIPKTMLPGLIRALTTTKDAYEARFGTINEPQVQK
jgi:hypothetical protein